MRRLSLPNRCRGPFEFVARKKGGVLVKRVVEGSLAEELGTIRRSMWLRKVGKTTVEGWSLGEVLCRLSSLDRLKHSVKLTLQSAPGVDWEEKRKK